MRLYDYVKQEEYLIAVPSRGRADLVSKKMGVWKYLEPSLYNVNVYTNEEDLDSYLGFLPDEVVFDLPNHVSIAQKKQVILKKCIDEDIEFLFLLDDDIVLSYRDEELPSKYRSKYEEFEKGDHFNKLLWESMRLCSEDSPIVGLPLKQGSSGLKYMFPKNTPIIRWVCLHVPTLKKLGIQLDGLQDEDGNHLPFMGDRYTQLSLLRAGHISLTNCRYAVDDLGTNYKGGCSLSRSVEIQSECARALCRTFPEAVTLKSKSNGNWEDERLDCSIRWKHYLMEGEEPFVPAIKLLPSFGGLYD